MKELIIPLHWLFLLIFVSFFWLVGCSTGQQISEDSEVPVEDLYNEGMSLIEAGNYSSAVLAFEKLEQQHPYSVWATRSQVMSAFSYYQGRRYDDSVLAAERFIQLHPAAPEVSYAYYLIGLSYYQQIVDVGRDQRAADLALQSFEQLIQRFPSSDYSVDARLKVDLIFAQLAGREMEIGRYYQKRGKYLAALNRFREVTSNYQTTHYVPEALHRLTEIYMTLGLTEEARSTTAILGHNFPQSEWYKDSFYLFEGSKNPGDESNESLFLRIFKRIF